MDDITFKKFQDLIYKESGICLKEGKETLVASRITKRMNALGIDTARKYYDYVVADSSRAEVVCLLDAISTNVTSFFRESDHFQFLAKLVSDGIKQGQKTFRFWSAASSTGEEPYTMAMVISEMFREANLNVAQADVKILATDIATKVLVECKKGIYSSQKLEAVRSDWKSRYFSPVSGERDKFVVSDELKKMITFTRINLSQPPFPMRGPFDAIFCRNVMIYFDNDIRSKLVNEMWRLLKPTGYLFVGHSESLTGFRPDMTVRKPSVYQKGEVAA